MAKLKKLGRPATINWSKFNLQWKNKTDREIADAAGCTYTNVYLHRKNLIQKAKDAGKPFDHLVCTKAKWTRAIPKSGSTAS